MNKKLFFASIAITLVAGVFNSCEKEDPDAVSMEVLQAGIIKIEGKDGKTYDVVDMGFPSGTMWATCNIGANSPEENGSFFAWGETKPKAVYSMDTYSMYYEGDAYKILKYCTNDERGYVNKEQKAIDNKAALDSVDNAAIVIMGNNWNIPTTQEYSELMYRSTKRWCKINGVYGYLFTSTEKGYEDRSVFFPMSGQNDGDSNEFIGKFGFYWTRVLAGGYSYAASVLQMDHKTGDNITVTNTRKERYMGLPVRPIVNQYNLNKH